MCDTKLTHSYLGCQLCEAHFQARLCEMNSWPGCPFESGGALPAVCVCGQVLIRIKARAYSISINLHLITHCFRVCVVDAGAQTLAPPPLTREPNQSTCLSQAYAVMLLAYRCQAPNDELDENTSERGRSGTGTSVCTEEMHTCKSSQLVSPLVQVRVA